MTRFPLPVCRLIPDLAFGQFGGEVAVEGRGAPECGEHRQVVAAAAQHLARDYLRHRGIRDQRVRGPVSNHRSGGCDSDSKGQK